MHTFKDTEGREWVVTLNVAVAKRIKALAGVNLMALVDDGLKPLAALLADPVALVDVLYAICKDQVEARKLTDEDFGRAFSGDVLLAAADAFREELVDFFPDPKARAQLRLALEKSKRVGEKLQEHSATELAKIDPEKEAEKFIAQQKEEAEKAEAQRKKDGGSSGTAPAS